MGKPTQLSLFDKQVEEKPALEKESAANDELPKTYKGIYAMHKYWAKKPHNLIANFIKRFSSPGDIVIDTFCGSGVTVIESVRLKRRAIGVDINPIAILITQMGLSPVDIEILKQCFSTLKTEIKPTIDNLYRTECPKCGNPDANVTHTIWENDHPNEVWYECSQCKTRKGIRAANEDDRKAASEPIEPPRWHPTTRLVENARINAKANMRVSDLFTKRALVGLSLLFESINQIEDENIRSVMRFCFNAALPQASNMVFVIRRRGKTTGTDGKGKAEVGSWVVGYWVPKEHFEINAWRCFENRFKRVTRGKKEVNSVIPSSAVKCSDYAHLSRVREGHWVYTGTATELPIPAESVDYALVDPPHGNRMLYLELSLMWNSWLGYDSDWGNEIIISESRRRKKDIDDYRKRIKTAFEELWRVLKPNKYGSVVFNSLDDETWLSLLNTCLAAGFEIKEIQPLAYSAHSVIQDTRKQALKTDFVITCQKKVPRHVSTVVFVDGDSELLHSKISEFMRDCTNGAETYQVLNHLFFTSIPMGKIFRISQILKALEDKFKYTKGRWYLHKSDR